MFHAHSCPSASGPSRHAALVSRPDGKMMKVIDRGIISGQPSSSACQDLGQSLPGTLDRSPLALAF